MNTEQSMDRKSVFLGFAALLSIGAAALVWLLDTGTPVFLPLMCALMAGVVFAPLADFFDRLGAPRVVGALMVLALILSVTAIAVYIFYPIVARLIQRVPFMWYKVQGALSGLKETVQSMESVQQKVSEALSGPVAKDPVSVPSIADVLSYLPSIAAQILIFVGILYFFLLTRTDIYRFIDRHSDMLNTKVLCRAETEVSRYFLTITAINAGFAVLVTLMLTVLEMPHAIYWGLISFLANFILYLGPISFAIALLVGSVLTFNGAMIFAPPALFMLMNMVEGQFVTPSLVGRHMSVNPLLVFLSLVFFMWLWGPLGGIVAIPILVWLRQMNEAVRVTSDRSTGQSSTAPQTA